MRAVPVRTPSGLVPRAKFQMKHILSRDKLNQSMEKKKAPGKKNWIEDDSGPLGGSDSDDSGSLNVKKKIK